MPLSNKGYDEGTYVTLDMPFGQIVKGKALCSDGKLRTFSVTGMPYCMETLPARVSVKGRTVSGEIEFGQSMEGYGKRIVFHANQDGRNADLLPPWPSCA